MTNLRKLAYCYAFMVEIQRWELVETRTISGQGLIRFNFDNTYRAVRLYSSVIRRPVIDYVSKDYIEEPGLYARLQWLYKGDVLRNDNIVNLRQLFNYTHTPESQLYLSLVCAFQSTFDRLTTISQALGLIIVGPPDTIYWNNLSNRFDEVYCKCREGTAVQFKMYAIKYDATCPESEDNGDEPLYEPFPPASIPAGTPLTFLNVPASRPYDGIDDGGVTIPFPGDDTQPPTGEYPFGEPCELWNVTVRGVWSRGASPLEWTSTQQVYAPITEAPTVTTRINEDGSLVFADINVQCRGFALLGGCRESAVYTLAVSSATVNLDNPSDLTTLSDIEILRPSKV